jgi:hypothetical protein
MDEREPQPDADWALALLHEFAGAIVDCRDMVGIDRMAQTETGKPAIQCRVLLVSKEWVECPRPDGKVGDDKVGIDAENSSARTAFTESRPHVGLQSTHLVRGLRAGTGCRISI